MSLPTAHVSDIREAFIALKQSPRAESEVAGTLELIGSSFVADEPTIFGEVNEAYVKSELEWYVSQSLDVNKIRPKVPKIWQEIADSRGFVNSNYGYLLYSKDNGNQYGNVVNQLRMQPDGRRAVAIYTRPSMHTDWSANGMRDFVCTNAVDYYLRHGRLNAVVQMRSNDVVFGYRNDFAWQTHVLEHIATAVGAEPGTITWQAGSLHVYARHYHLIPDSSDIHFSESA